MYATEPGPPSRDSRLWAALLRAGPGATLSHQTAAEVGGLLDGESTTIHITVPTTRTPDPIPDVVLHRSTRVAEARHPTRTLPQTRIEETVIDLTQSASALDEAIGWLATAVGSRLTTVDRLRQTMATRSRLRWRSALRTALDDIALGCHSVLELRYLRDVERAHRLPPGHRQARDRSRAIYHDVHYRNRTVVELDGRAAHDRPHRDMRRDNRTVAEGHQVLRYGWTDVTDAPCRVAAQVIGVLRRGGWRGRPRACGRPGCPVVSTPVNVTRSWGSDRSTSRDHVSTPTIGRNPDPGPMIT